MQNSNKHTLGFETIENEIPPILLRVLHKSLAEYCQGVSTYGLAALMETPEVGKMRYYSKSFNANVRFFRMTLKFHDKLYVCCLNLLQNKLNLT